MSLESLLDKLYNEPDNEVRQYIPDKLAKLGSWDATEHLGKMLEDEKQPEELRNESAEALGKLGDPRGLNYLSGIIDLSITHEVDTELLRTVIWSIGQIGETRGLDLLNKLVDEAVIFGKMDEKCRKSIPKAMTRIAKLHDMAIVPQLLEYYDTIENYHCARLSEARVLDDVFRSLSQFVFKANQEELHVLRTISWDRFIHSPTASNEQLTSLRLYRVGSNALMLSVENEELIDEFELVIDELWRQFSEFTPALQKEAITLFLDLSSWFSQKIDCVQNMMASIYQMGDTSLMVLEQMASRGELDYILSFLLKYHVGDSIDPNSFDHWKALFRGLSLALLDRKEIDADPGKIIGAIQNIDNLDIELNLEFLRFLSLHQDDPAPILSQSHDPTYKFPIIGILTHFPNHEEGLEFIEKVVKAEKRGMKHTIFPALRKIVSEGNANTVKSIQNIMMYVRDNHKVWHTRRDARKLLNTIDHKLQNM